MGRDGDPLLIRQYQVSAIPSASAVKPGTVIAVYNSAYSGDSVTGGGSVPSLLQSSGSAWQRPNPSPIRLSLTIASDEITLPVHAHSLLWQLVLDTEGGGATDNLQDINNVVVGDIVLIQSTVGARDIVLKHATGGGNLRHNMHGSGDKTLGDPWHYAYYFCRLTTAVDLAWIVN